MNCPEFPLFYYDNTLLSPEVLEEAFNKLPASYKEALTLREGEIEIGGFKQFLSYYSGKKLAFRDKRRAEDMFLSIFLDNLFLIEQIRNNKEAVEELGNIEKNGKTVTSYKSQGGSDSVSASNQLTTDKAQSVDSQDTSLITLNSDSNSSGLIEAKGEGQQNKMIYLTQENSEPMPERLSFPVNSLQKNSTHFKDVSLSESSSTLLNMAAVKGQETSTSVTESTNAADDGRTYLLTEIPELRRKFGKKFERLFLY